MENTITLQGGWTTRHLLPCDGGYLQVEAGSQKKYALFRRQLEERGIEPEQIRYLFLTHHHEDHAGFTAALKEASGCRIIAHRDAVPYLEKGQQARTRAGLVNWRSLLVVLYVFLTGWSLNFPPLALSDEDHVLEGDDDELLRSLGVSGRALYTPGHSPDSISLLMDDGRCFCGDAAMNNPRWLGTRYCCILMSDVGEYYASWRKMVQEGARTVYPAHGQPFPAERLEQHLDHFSQEDLVGAK